MDELATFILSTSAVSLAIVAFAVDDRRRSRNAISENLALSDDYTAPNPALAQRFRDRADRIALTYLGEVEAQPTTYSRTAVGVALLVSLVIVAVVGASLDETISPTAAAAGGLLVGLTTMVLTPVIHRFGATVRSWAAAVRHRLF